MIKYNDLKTRQNEILDFIKKYIAQKEESPSIREIAKAVNLNSPATVYVHIKNLIKKGYLKKNNDKSLELLIPNEYDSTNNIIQIPILDFNFETKKFENLKNVKNFLTFPSVLIPQNTNVFAITINDNTLINEGIKKEDIIIIQENSNYTDNDNIIMFDNNKIILNSYRNTKITNKNETKLANNKIILGKLISLYRNY